MANDLTVTSELAGAGAPPVDDAVPGYIPEGWKSAEEFLEYARKEYAADVAYDRDNRDMALEDLKFIAGDQWDPAVAKARQDKGRPVLTINVLPQFVGQVIGDRRLNQTSIKVRPVRDATQELADVRSGIIKGIEAHSRAERVYDAACEDQVSCGISNMRVDMEYAGNDVFDQDIFIRHIPNPLAVIWDRISVDPTGRDARHCFVQDTLPRDVFEKQYPDAPSPSSLGDTMTADLMSAGWFDKDVIRLTEYWEMVNKPATFAMMQDGSVQDVTGLEPDTYAEALWRHPVSGKPKIRKGFRSYARMHIITGHAILTGAYELPLNRLPIIKVEGRVVRVGEDRVRYGLVRYAKDSQRLKNYWRSVAAETLALAPKAQWVAADDAIEGREDEWRNSHQTGETVLIYNSKGEKPERADPPTMPAALMQEAQMNQQDIKDTTGLQDASLGMRSNEISGRAIQARQREGDVATVIYHDNLNASIQEVGDITNQLIPVAYDTVRTLRVVGPDDKHQLTTVNDPNDDNSPDITQGKYDVQLETGPSFTTQRQEALDAMMTIVQTSPGMMAIAGDLVVKNMDWPGAYEISERLKQQMKKEGTLPPDPQDQPSPEQLQAQMQQQQIQQAQLQEAAAQLQHAQQMRDLELQQAGHKMEQAQADAAASQAQAQEADAKRRRAEAEATRTEIEAQYTPQIMEHKVALAERAVTAKERPQPSSGAGQRGRQQRGGQSR